MHSTDRPGGTAGRPERNAKNSVRATSPGPMILDRANRSADAEPASKRQSGGTTPFFEVLARMPAKLWIVGVGGIAVLLFLLFAVVRPWLPDLTTSARDDAPISKPTTNSTASTSAATTPSLQRTDNDRSVVPIRPATDLPGQKPTVAVIIPRSNTSPNEQASDPPSQTEVSPPRVTPSQTAPQANPQQLDLGQVEDAKRVQQRLIDLGYLFGAADGAWGPRSRKALQDFRVANGIGDNDTWDEATQERLFTASDAIAASTSDISFIGGWGVDAAQCRESPLTITERRAEAFGAACEFHSTQRESSNIWRLRAQCTNNSERWNANIRFTLSGSRLTWSSERGTTTYVRCPS